MDLTVIVCTYNRAHDLAALLASIEQQKGVEDFEFEVLVVDNNSTDGTRAAVEVAVKRGLVPIRYEFEGRQGKSYALNRGVQIARGEIVTITDDDQVMPQTYVRQLLEAFQDHPDKAFIGGKVLPIWEAPPPDWLTREHWGPLGMLDHGDQPFTVNAERPICLLTCAFRRADLLRAGGYREELGVSASAIGSTEDAEILERLWNSGGEGLYLPGLVLQHKAPAGRMTRSYYRRWHRGHGEFQALRRNPATEASRGRLFGVPLHFYRQAAADAVAFCAAALTGRRQAAFHYDTQLQFFRGFVTKRLSDRRAVASGAIGSAAAGSGTDRS
jgi:glucosyl-dolichyl phosphate glucuronosyltransferase